MGEIQDLFERARKIIPLKYLREQFPDIRERGKDPFIKAWHDKDPKELADAVAYFEATRERSAFFYKLPKLSKGLDAAKLATLLAKQSMSDKQGDWHCDVVEATPDSSKNKVYARVHLHTKEYRFPNAEHTKTFVPLKNVQFRLGKAAHLVIHVDERIVEAKTHSGSKAAAAAQAIAYVACKDGKACEQITFDPKTLAKIDKDVRFQQATVQNLNIAGANEITIKGTDVAQTIEHFKQKGIDLGTAVEYQKSTCENRPFKFFQNGKVKANGTVDDLFEALKEYMK